jgi:asparagine synthase (glutamine-hydrolysing)
MSMSQGLEVRVPLIDHLLAKKVLALPGAWKLNGSGPKTLLVQMLANTLPSEIVHRPKRGFTLPFEHWLRAELRSEVEPVLKKKFSEGSLAGILNGSQASRIWQDFLAGTTSWTRPWSLYVLDRWCELHSLTA